LSSLVSIKFRTEHPTDGIDEKGDAMAADASTDDGLKAPAAPAVLSRAAFEDQLGVLRAWEKAHAREGDALAAARRRLPMVEVDSTVKVIGAHGPVTLLDVFEGRRQLIAYYFMWYVGRPAAEQCEGCTFVTTHVRELSYLHSRDVTYATLCQGPYEESVRYRDFMGWEMPWYSAQDSAKVLLAGRQVGKMHLVCYLRENDRVFETYWTTGRGVEMMMAPTYPLLDRTIYGRQEAWEDSPAGWPKKKIMEHLRKGEVNLLENGRPIAQWARLKDGHSDDLGTGGR
jgi:predicted dithiol-disulfide oxidoreductase (DUF899 family)